MKVEAESKCLVDSAKEEEERILKKAQQMAAKVKRQATKEKTEMLDEVARIRQQVEDQKIETERLATEFRAQIDEDKRLSSQSALYAKESVMVQVAAAEQSTADAQSRISRLLAENCRLREAHLSASCNASAAMLAASKVRNSKKMSSPVAMSPPTRSATRSLTHHDLTPATPKATTYASNDDQSPVPSLRLLDSHDEASTRPERLISLQPIEAAEYNSVASLASSIRRAEAATADSSACVAAAMDKARDSIADAVASAAESSRWNSLPSDSQKAAARFVDALKAKKVRAFTRNLNSSLDANSPSLSMDDDSINIYVARSSPTQSSGAASSKQYYADRIGFIPKVADVHENTRGKPRRVPAQAVPRVGTASTTGGFRSLGAGASRAERHDDHNATASMRMRRAHNRAIEATARYSVRARGPR